MSFFGAMFRNEKGEPEEIMFFGTLMLLVNVAMSVYSVVTWHGRFDALEFGGGCAAIMGAMAGMKPLRDRWMRQPPPPGHPVPGMPTQP